MRAPSVCASAREPAPLVAVVVTVIELAAKTGTPLVIYSEGKIKKLRIPPRQVTKSS